MALPGGGTLGQDAGVGTGTRSRRAWEVLEPLHAVVYFAPEVLDRYRACGLRGFWMGYFAGRALPLHGAPADVVTATFFGFHPAMVERALPDAWGLASPEAVLAARLDGVTEALERLLGPDAADPGVAEAADLAEAAARAARPDGRALFAAHRSLEWPGTPLLRLWHAATLLREHRGDGHVAATLAAGLDGLGAHVLVAAEGRVPRSALQPNRGWSDAEWADSEADLTDRDWIEGGEPTEIGRAVRSEIEDRTDALADGPWHGVGDDATERVIDLVRPLAERIIDHGGIPIPNPMGVPRPRAREQHR
jgi:hypothetical protein